MEFQMLVSKRSDDYVSSMSLVEAKALAKKKEATLEVVAPGDLVTVSAGGAHFGSSGYTSSWSVLAGEPVVDNTHAKADSFVQEVHTCLVMAEGDAVYRASSDCMDWDSRPTREVIVCGVMPPPTLMVSFSGGSGRQILKPLSEVECWHCASGPVDNTVWSVHESDTRYTFKRSLDRSSAKRGDEVWVEHEDQDQCLHRHRIVEVSFTGEVTQF